MIKKYILIILCSIPFWASAQVGEHRNQFAIGLHGGLNLNTVSFVPNVNQKMFQGMEGGLMVRYTCEKYFKTICSIQMEFNYSQLGWDEDIIDGNNNPVPATNGDANERYKRTINYFQIPILAHLAWGKEKKGVNFFFEAGPALGIYLNDEIDTNFTPTTINEELRNAKTDSELCEKEIQNKFDYGIAAGGGVELHIKSIGRLQLSGRYYYGLGNLFYDSKRDYFSRSNHQTITIRAAYLFDL